MGKFLKNTLIKFIETYSDFRNKSLRPFRHIALNEKGREANTEQLAPQAAILLTSDFYFFVCKYGPKIWKWIWVISGGACVISFGLRLCKTFNLDDFSVFVCALVGLWKVAKSK